MEKAAAIVRMVVGAGLMMKGCAQRVSMRIKTTVARMTASRLTRQSPGQSAQPGEEEAQHIAMGVEGVK